MKTVTLVRPDENGRMVFTFCEFEELPRGMRIGNSLYPWSSIFRVTYE